MSFRNSMPRLKPAMLFGRRSFCSARPPTTKIVLLHFGYPRTEFYAKEFLRRRALLYYNVPRKIQQFLPLTFMSNETVRRCIERYGERPSFEATLNSFSKEVSAAASRLVPEHGRIDVEPLFYFDEPNGSFEERLDAILRSKSPHIVFMPYYSHFSTSLSGTLIRLVAERIAETTVTAAGDKDNTVRYIPSSSISFRTSLIHRFNSHPMISQFWRTNLEERIKQFEGVLFVAPVVRDCGSTEYRHGVWANCERVMSELGHSLPWKLAFYNSWHDWPIPISCEGYPLQSRALIGKAPFEKRVAVVPITALLPEFDTFSRLPDLVKGTNKTSLAATLIEPPSHSSILVQGLAEVIKNHLLGRQHAQIRLFAGRKRNTAVDDVFIKG